MINVALHYERVLLFRGSTLFIATARNYHSPTIFSGSIEICDLSSAIIACEIRCLSLFAATKSHWQANKLIKKYLSLMRAVLFLQVVIIVFLHRSFSYNSRSRRNKWPAATMKNICASLSSFFYSLIWPTCHTKYNTGQPIVSN